MYVFAYFAAAGIVALGGSMVVSPLRTTRALHEWYIVPPAVLAKQRVRVALCRLIGVVLIAGGCWLAASITHALAQSV